MEQWTKRFWNDYRRWTPDCEYVAMGNGIDIMYISRLADVGDAEEWLVW